MKKWWFFVFVGLFCACSDDEPGVESLVGPNPRFSFSELSITRTAEGSTAEAKRIFEYKNKMLLTHTYEQTFGGGSSLITFNISAAAASHTYSCSSNYGPIYSIKYSVNDLLLADTATYTYVDYKDDPRGYKMKYETIDGKYYLKSITEYSRGEVYYALTFNYDRFGLGEIGLTQTQSQTILGEKQQVERFWATLYITRDNKGGIPDMIFSDPDLHPLDKHFEALFGGLFGTFGYFVSEIHKETQTVVSRKEETIVSSVQFKSGYPDKITSTSTDPSKAVKYYEFGYK